MSEKYKMLCENDSKKTALTFEIDAECSITKARTARMYLHHGLVHTPVFMPVGTQGSMKGLVPQQLEHLGCEIMLSNTYHLGTRPGIEVIEKAGGLHKFMGWNRPLLTDSGGFQMVSLLELAEITEDGVKFKSPYNDKECMLTPEHSIEIQNVIGADIMMQLDDVVETIKTGPRVEEGMYRTNRWLERCIKAHKNTSIQNLFPIVQGNLNPELRKKSAEHHMKCDVNGFAVGGLSGGESKDDFWKIVHLCTDILPKNKPRYLMGVGYSIDLLVCSALGIDMFDCVFPTRTARFGCALIGLGQINLKKSKFAFDFAPIEEDCDCTTCKRYTRAYINKIVTKYTVGCHLITVHNIAHHLNFMRNIRTSIIENRFPEFVQKCMFDFFSTKEYPQWAVDAFNAVNIKLLDLDETPKPT